MPSNRTYFLFHPRIGLGAAYGAAVRLLVLCCLFAMSGVLPCTLPASAQDTVEKEGEVEEVEQDNKRPVRKWRLGLHYSRIGLKNRSRQLDIARWSHAVTSPAQDVMPYPALWFNIRYDAYEISLAGARDNRYPAEAGSSSSVNNGAYDGNESILRFTARYNYYYYRDKIYAFGGFLVWHFHKKFNHTNYVSIEGRDIGTPIITSRPLGRRIIPGITIGTGIEYKIGSLILTHELEAYIAACSHDNFNFICRGADYKFVGLNISF